MGSFSGLINDHKSRFKIFSDDSLKFITSNFFFGLFNPFYLIFSNTFIYTATQGNIEMNLVYCIFTFIGITSGFYITGIASQKFGVKTLLITGVWLLFISITVMFSVPGDKITREMLLFFGLLTGLGSGIYWSSRNFLTFSLTDNNNRDFFSGIDYILISSGRIITPLIVGIYIGAGIKFHWFSAMFAYRSVLLVALVITVVITLISLRVKTNIVRKNNTFRTQRTAQWKQVLTLFVFLGFFQGTFFVVPSVFIMKFVGAEGAVGTINSIGYLIAIVVVYFISRASGAKQRTGIVRIGFLLFLVGSVTFSFGILTLPALGTNFLIFMMFLTEPVLSFPIRATLLNVIGKETGNTSTDGYAHLVQVELYTAYGRVASLVVFYALYAMMPAYLSLPVYIVAMSLVQYGCVIYSQKINGK